VFPWKEEYHINEAIDREHQHLLGLADRVMAIVDPVAEAEKVGATIREVYGYMKYHFDNEQKRMQDVEYPGYDEHIQKHEEIIAKVNTMLKQGYEIKRLTAEFRKIMVDWVIQHVMEEDKKFAAYLQDQVPAGA
jgi:hemerythrin